MFAAIWDGFVGAVVDALNAVIAALAAVINGLFALLPDLPDLPEPPEAYTMAYGWVAWVFPVGTLIEILLFVLSMWLIWQVVALALRWAKALGN